MCGYCRIALIYLLGPWYFIPFNSYSNRVTGHLVVNYLLDIVGKCITYGIESLDLQDKRIAPTLWWLKTKPRDEWVWLFIDI